MSDRVRRHNVSTAAWRKRLCLPIAATGLAMGLASSSLAVSFARIRLNVQDFNGFATGGEGSMVVVGNLGTGLVWPLHEAFGGRIIPIWLPVDDAPVSISFQQFLPPDANGQLGLARGMFYRAHETAAASAIAGKWDPITGVDPAATIRSVIGFAPDAKIILSGGFAGGVSDNGIVIGNTPLAEAFALFAMIDPEIAAFAASPEMLNISPYPVASVVNASFGSVATEKDRTGEALLAHAFDAAVWKTDAVIITAAGDDRRNPDLLNQINTNPADPGGTVGSPGTAYNVLNVGRFNRGLSSPETNSSDGPVGIVDWRSSGVTLISTVPQIALPMGCTITMSLPESMARERDPVDIAAPGTILTLAGSPAFDNRFFTPASTNVPFTAPGPITLLPGDETNKKFTAAGPITLTGGSVDQTISAPGPFTLAGANTQQMFSTAGPFVLAANASATLLTSAGAYGGTLTSFTYSFTYGDDDTSFASDMKITITDGVNTVSIAGADSPGIAPSYQGASSDAPGVYFDTIDLSTSMIAGATLTITISNNRAADASANTVSNFSATLGGIALKFDSADPNSGSGPPTTIFDSAGASAGTLGLFTYSFTYGEPTLDSSLASDMRIVISDGTNTAVIGGSDFPGSFVPSYNGSISDAPGVYGDTIDLSAVGITVTANPPTNLTITISDDRGGDPNVNTVANFTATLGGIFNSGGVPTTIFDNTAVPSMAGTLGTFSYSFHYDEPVQDSSVASDIRIVISDGNTTAVIGGNDFAGFTPSYLGDTTVPGDFGFSIDLSALGINGSTLTVSLANDNAADLNPNVVSNFTATLGGVRDGILFTGGSGATGTLGVFSYSFTYAEPILDGSFASDMKITITDGVNSAVIGGLDSPGVFPSYQGAGSNAPGVYPTNSMEEMVDLSSFAIDGSTLTVSISNDRGADINANVITNFSATLNGVNTVALNPDVNPADPTAGVTRSFAPLWEGTSFASAIIAGAAAVIQDIGIKNDLWLPEFIPLKDAQGNTILDSRGQPSFVPMPQLDAQGSPILDSAGNPLFVTHPSGLVTRAILINSVDESSANVQPAQNVPGPEQDACITTQPLDRRVGSGLIDFKKLKKQLLANQVMDVRPNGMGGSSMNTPFPYMVDGVVRTLNGITRGSYNPTLDDPTDVIRRDPPPFDPNPSTNTDIGGGVTPEQVSEDIPQVLPLPPIPGVSGNGQGWFHGWGNPSPGFSNSVAPVVAPTPHDGPVISKGTDPRKPFVTSVQAPVEGSGGPIMAPPQSPKPKTGVTVFPQGAHALEQGPAQHKKPQYRPYGQPQIVPPQDPDLRGPGRFSFGTPTIGAFPGPMAGPGSGTGSTSGSATNTRPSNAGWDHGKLGVGHIDYPIGIITPNSSIRATLVWNRTEIWSEAALKNWQTSTGIIQNPLRAKLIKPLMSLAANDPTSAFPAPNQSPDGRDLPTIQSAFAFENLDLELFRVNPNPGVPPGFQNFLIGASRSTWGTVEHISVGAAPALCRPQNNSDVLFGEYFLRVKYTDTMFDLGGYRYCGGFQTLHMINEGSLDPQGGIMPPGAYKNLFPSEAEFAVAWFVDLANSTGISFIQSLQDNPRDFNHDGVINAKDVSAMVAASLGDMNNDGVIGAADVAILLTNFGSDDIAYDLNFDGVVNSGDLGEMLVRYGKTPSP